MKNGFVKSITLAVGIALVFLIVSGCQEQTTATQKCSIKAPPDAAGVQVKQTGGRSSIEVKKPTAEIEMLKASLNQCQEENEALKKAQEKSLDEMGEEAMNAFDENIKLQEEVQKLQKQIEELKKGSKSN